MIILNNKSNHFFKIVKIYKINKERLKIRQIIHKIIFQMIFIINNKITKKIKFKTF